MLQAIYAKYTYEFLFLHKKTAKYHIGSNGDML